jgi:hypothetical protein
MRLLRSPTGSTVDVPHGRASASRSTSSIMEVKRFAAPVGERTGLSRQLRTHQPRCAPSLPLPLYPSEGWKGGLWRLKTR